MKHKVAALTLSAVGLVGIAGWETYRGEAYYATPHEREVGISTIGWGSTEGVKPTDRTTPDRALVRLVQTTSAFEEQLKACLNPGAEITQGQWDALVSWAFNIGTGAACKSTLVRKLNAGQEWCRELLRWDRQAGQVLPGLTKRRQKEYQQCVGG